MPETGFWGRFPLAWAGFAALLLGIPALGMARERGVDIAAILPTVNALLNAISAALVFAAWRAIRAGRVGRHWRLMLSATVTSAVFLFSYLVRFAMTGTHRYPAHGWSRAVYLAVLSSHTLLAATVPFLVVAMLVLAARKRYDRHKRLARFALPIWLYVSITGVLVYLMLYHVGPRLA